MILGRLLLISICSWYEIEEHLKEIDIFLEFNLEERGDLPLISSISTSEGKWVIESQKELAEECETCIFTTFPMGTTIQDGDKRERSDVE